MPDGLIAQVPLEERTQSRLLYLNRETGEIQDHKFVDLRKLLRPGDLLVLNDTRVTALRLHGTRSSGGAVELLLLNEISPWKFRCLAKPAKRLRMGDQLQFGTNLRAEVSETLEEGHRVITFEPIADFDEVLSQLGSVPLPPYIRSHLADAERYQTVLANHGGSAAAPTAALHFSTKFLNVLQEEGIDIATVTLDVGIDTFRPVQAEDLAHHRMHGERCSVPPETVLKVENCPGRIVAVGTTTVRTLETFAKGNKQLESGERVSKIFIQPGYDFQIVDGMLTNFHLPKTTMLMMISAMAGRKNILSAYDHAVDESYRFLSFGDSMLIL